MEKNWNVGTVYLNDRTRIIVMGITGREASQVVAESEALYPGFIVAGVTPGKGGSEVAGKPVYNTVREALEKHPEINTGIVYVPPASVKDAVIELVDAGIKLIYIITEHVPIRDTVYFYHYAKERGVIIVGPHIPWLHDALGASKDRSHRRKEPIHSLRKGWSCNPFQVWRSYNYHCGDVQKKGLGRLYGPCLGR